MDKGAALLAALSFMVLFKRGTRYSVVFATATGKLVFA